MRGHILRWAGALAALLLVIGPFAGGRAAAYAESNGGVRVMPLGDSITDGITVPGAYRIGLWQRFVNDGYKVDFVGSLSNGPAALGDHDHEGHSGWRIDHITATVPSAEVFVATIIPLANAGQETSVRAFDAAIPGIAQSKVAAGRHVHLVDMHAALVQLWPCNGGTNQKWSLT